MTKTVTLKSRRLEFKRITIAGELKEHRKYREIKKQKYGKMRKRERHLERRGIFGAKRIEGENDFGDRLWLRGRMGLP